MKRIIYPLTVLVWVTLACGLSTPAPPAPPTREAAPAATTETAASQPEEQPPTPALPPPTQPAVTSAAEDAPAGGRTGIDVSKLAETENDAFGISSLAPKPYADALAAGSRVVNLEPMDTFFVLWVPDGYAAMENRRVMVVAHGHGGNAYWEMGNELPFAQERGYAVVTIQWGSGDGEQMYSGQQFYQFMDAALQYMEYKYKAQLDKCAFRGWSLGSEISYEVTYLDRVNGNGRLALTISHDGGIMPDPNDMAVGREFALDLYDGAYGDEPFNGAHFYLYAGEEIQIEHMRNTEQVITSFGGVVERLITDEGAGHDGFYRHPQYHEEALDIFFRLTD